MKDSGMLEVNVNIGIFKVTTFTIAVRTEYKGISDVAIVVGKGALICEPDKLVFSLLKAGMTTCGQTYVSCWLPW